VTDGLSALELDENYLKAFLLMLKSYMGPRDFQEVVKYYEKASKCINIEVIFWFWVLLMVFFLFCLIYSINLHAFKINFLTPWVRIRVGKMALVSKLPALTPWGQESTIS
jgi:hypothetical protein